ncbi:radical SAM protein [Treponema endosymbiont of Eucomonympha sp.]|uniref:radical SAM protein n=1 Tax=Treponema endosymbiont of Eucomonympha sp. TaxID=1580831 RepID=UPI000751A76B|nr:radical SAM protein [Treponema endosymbiont of Eucomonympha sp.]
MQNALTKDAVFRNIELTEKLFNAGVAIDDKVLQELDYKNQCLEQVHGCFNMNHNSHTATKLPNSFRDETGYSFGITYDPKSHYSILSKQGLYYLYDNGHTVFEIFFQQKPKYYDKLTSDGTPMSRIAQYVGRSKITITYSNECSLGEKGLDCLFCNINATRNTYAELEGLKWKTARQIAETTKAAYDEGYRRLTVTGGFIPERREVDYYIDVAEEIQKETGLEDFGGTACIGAPLDLGVIDRYKEAGYSSIATNMEIWDSNMFKTICPGKEELCGGRQNWINALKHEVAVFGKGHVRSYFVAGIEPKASLLEGIEYLIEAGVVAIPLQWNPNPGSALEGHRAPTAEWYHDVYLKTYTLLRKHGFSHENFYNTTNGEETVFDYLYNVDCDILPWERDIYRSLEAKSA